MESIMKEWGKLSLFTKVTLGGGLFFLLIGWLFSSPYDSTSNGKPISGRIERVNNIIPENKSTPTPQFNAGDIALLTGPAFIGRTEEDLKLINKSYISKDYDQIKEMIFAGSALSVEDNIKVKLIDFTFGNRQVRIMEGPHKGQKAWVRADYLSAIAD